MHRNRDAVAEDLGEIPPGLEPPNKRLMTCPHSPCIPTVSAGFASFPRHFKFVLVATVTLVGLDLLTRLEEMMQNLVENFNGNTYQQGRDPGSTPGSPQECRPPARSST